MINKASERHLPITQRRGVYKVPTRPGWLMTPLKDGPRNLLEEAIMARQARQLNLVGGIVTAVLVSVAVVCFCLGGAW